MDLEEICKVKLSETLNEWKTHESDVHGKHQRTKKVRTNDQPKALPRSLLRNSHSNRRRSLIRARFVRICPNPLFSTKTENLGNKLSPNQIPAGRSKSLQTNIGLAPTYMRALARLHYSITVGSGAFRMLFDVCVDISKS